MNAIDIHKIEKKYKTFHLLIEDITFNQGDIIGLIGPNGAGKSTLINILFNLIDSDVNEFRIINMNYNTNEKEIRNLIGYASEDTPYFNDKTIKWNEKFFSAFYDNWRKDIFNKYCKQFNLDTSKKISELSKGMRIKLYIIFALSINPKIIILDEPTSGIDPIDRNEILKLLKRILETDPTKMILISSHISEDLDQIASKLMFLKNGECVEYCDTKSIYSKYPGTNTVSELIKMIYDVQ